MALSDSALSELFDALRVGDGTDLVRELAQWALQALIDVEAADKIGAGRYERSGERVTHRNGTRSKTLSTKAGDLTVGIPKLRKGSFFPELLEPRRRIDQALYAVIMEAYVNGVSTRSVDDLVAEMGVDTGISKSEVSRICAGLDERVDAFRNRTESPWVSWRLLTLETRMELCHRKRSQGSRPRGATPTPRRLRRCGWSASSAPSWAPITGR